MFNKSDEEKQKKEISLGDHFTFRRLLRFVAPSIFMMVFTSIYGVVDGLFISNFVGKTPFAAVNLIMPFLMIMGAVGFMFGTGGSAIVSKTLGEGKPKEANEYFSLIVYVTAISGVVLTGVGEAIVPYVARLFKAEGEMFDYCVLYGRIILIAVPFFMLQNVFQAFFTTAGKPLTGFIVTVIAGVTNMVLDAVFVAGFRWGVTGAAVATGVSQLVGGVIPVVYFVRKNTSLLRLGRAKFNGKVLLKTVTNGSSEFINNISSSVVGMVYNYQLLKLAGENGVAAYGVLMYVNFIYVAIFIGYSIGTAPLVGFNYGAQNHEELKNIYKKSMICMGVCGVLMTGLALALAYPVGYVFVGYDADLYAMTVTAFFISSPCFIFAGFSIFTSSLFTALNNGVISAVISFMRTLIFQIVTVLVLPIFWHLNGVWLSMLFADVLACTVSFIFAIVFRKRYGYM